MPTLTTPKFALFSPLLAISSLTQGYFKRERRR
jgi:hypothetical protein